MQDIEIVVGLDEAFDEAQGVLEEVGLFNFGFDDEEVLLIFVGVVVVAGSDDEDAAGVLVDLDGVLLVVVVVKITEFAFLEGNQTIDLQFPQNCLHDVRPHARVDHHLHLLNLRQPLHEVFDLRHREKRFVVVPDLQRFLHPFRQPVVL